MHNVLQYRGHPVPKIERLQMEPDSPLLHYRITMHQNAQQVAVDLRDEEAHITFVKEKIWRACLEVMDCHPDGERATAFRQFLDFLHEQCGVIDTTVWERRERPFLSVEYADCQAPPLRPPSTATELMESQRDMADAMSYSLANGLIYGTPAPDVRTELHCQWRGQRGGKATAQKKRNTPERKAMALLYKRLNRWQRKDLKQNGQFAYTGEAGIYFFKLNDMSGVRLITTQKMGVRDIQTRYELCIQSLDPNMPKGDVILARYMECKTDEELFLSTCNFREANIEDEATRGAQYGTGLTQSINDSLRRIGEIAPETLMSASEMFNMQNEILRDVPWREE